MSTPEEIKELVDKLQGEDKTKLLGLIQGVIPKNGGAGGAGGDGQVPVENAQDRKPREGKTPKLPKFSGSQALKSEPSFRVWQFDVEDLKRNHGENEVRRAIHESVTGMAAEILTRLGQEATVNQILSKFQNIFGTVVSDQKLLADFYTAQQKSNESIAEWSCRLEEYLCHPNLNNLTSKNNMLKTRFFSGLFSDAIANSIRHLVESKTFEDLVVSAREAEADVENKSSKAVAKAQVVDPMLEQLKQIKASLDKLTTKSEEWERRLSTVEQQRATRPRQQSTQRSYHSTNTEQQNQPREVTCFYCKTPGHVKRNCQKYLNSRQSAARGGK